MMNTQQTAGGRAAESEAAPAAARGLLGRTYGAVSGGIGTLAGVIPHALHHVGPIAGAAVVSGAGGTLLFGIVGLLLTVPLLLQLRRRFHSWLAPAIALAIFAGMFVISTLWIGPAIRDGFDGGGDATPTEHDAHHVHAFARSQT